MFDGEPPAEAGPDADSAAQLIDEIAAWERVIARAHARQSMAIAAFTEQRIREDRQAGALTSEAGKYAAEEVALARRVSPSTADRQISFARALTSDHRVTLEAMLSGDVGVSAARTIVKECKVLESEVRRAVDADIAVEARDLTPGQVHKAVRRRVSEADASAAKKRASAARVARQLSFLPREDTMASLYNVLPAEQAAACWKALDHHARGRRADGDERSIQHIMCDTFVERLTGQRRASEIPVEIGVVISAASLLGNADTPATLGGYGAIPAELARQLAQSKSAFARRLVCDPLDGHVIAVNRRKRRFDGRVRRLILASDQVCRLPVCDAPIRDGDHVKPYSKGGETVRENGQGLCERSHYCRDHPGWRVEADPAPGSTGITWITPTGHRYDSYPPPALGPGSLDAEALRRLARRRRRRRRKPKRE